MLKIRLQRIGRRNDPHFRMLVAEHTMGPKSNKFVEKVGTYNPKTKDTQLNTERIKYWLSVGAQATDRVHNMLVKAGIIKADTINVLPQKTPVINEEEAKEKEEEKADIENTENTESTDNKVTEEAKEDDKEQVKEERPEESEEETKEEKSDEENKEKSE